MEYVQRLISLPELLKERSHFLFGPRTTGKSTLIRQQLIDAQVIDLLDSDLSRRLEKSPSLLRDLVQQKRVVIDEIQKNPALLNEVHWLIERKEITFLLTASSARKLKVSGVNLLAGRAWRCFLFPLTSLELGEKFNLLTYLNNGGLPSYTLHSKARKGLANYVDLYLREEIQAEALTRSITSFSEFLDLAALTNGEEVNFNSLSGDCGVSPNTIKNYYHILEDTLIHFFLPAFTKTKKRKAISRAKTYFFDVGVVNHLAKRGEIKEKSSEFGKAFEHFIILEIRAYLHYFELPYEMTYWRSTSQFEVDLILGQEWAIEIKSTNQVQEKHLKGLRMFKEEQLVKRYAVVSLDKINRKTSDGIECFYWTDFLHQLTKNMKDE